MDIVVFNAIKELEASLSSSGGSSASLPVDITAINTAIMDALANTAYLGSNRADLSALSTNGTLASVAENYSGLGTDSPQCNSAWSTFTGANQTAYQKLTHTEEFYVIKLAMLSLETSLSKQKLENYVEQFLYEQIQLASPTVKNAWSSFDEGRLLSSSFKVCDPQWLIGKGTSCIWTVPTSASVIKFQVWGAAAGACTGVCCSYNLFGPTAPYAEMTLHATPGDTYTMCTGCSCCASIILPCQSGVQGPGICYLNVTVQ